MSATYDGLVWKKNATTDMVSDWVPPPTSDIGSMSYAGSDAELDDEG